jgi:hypothetical protein
MRSVRRGPWWRRCGLVLAGGLTLVAGWSAWTVWDGLYVREGEAKAALRQLPYDIRLRHVSKPMGLRAVIAGQARARDGSTLDFAVVLGWLGKDAPGVPTALGRWPDRGVVLGNARVLAADPQTHGRLRGAQIEIEMTIEDAIFGRAPLRPRADV